MENQSFKSTVIYFLGGVCAIAPELYQQKLEQIASMYNRKVDDNFKNEIISILQDLPCQLD